MRYAAPWDRSLRVSTGALLAVLAFACAVVFAVTSAVGGGPVVGALGVFAIAVLVGVGLAAWALAPTGYAVEGGTLRIERRIRPVAVPLAEVVAVCRLAELRAAGTLRLGASSGFFGHYGRFWGKALGSFRLYATRTTDLVLLDLAGDRLVLSPDAPERFLAEVRAAAPAAAEVADPDALPRHPLPRRAKVALAAAIAAVPLLAGAVFLATSAFAPVGAAIDGPVIRIERRLAPAVEIPLARVHGAEVLGAEGGFRRVAGFAGPGISYGRFRSDALGDFQLWDWRLGEYVLLETDDGPVVLTPEDPVAFVAAVRAGMAGGGAGR